MELKDKVKKWKKLQQSSITLQEVQRKIDELQPFWKVFEKESDRSVAIVATCLLDDLLERIIRAAYVQDPQMKSLFKDSNILQPFFAKINIAYFSGLIPDIVYHDLKLICKIRNKFAHAIIADLSFTETSIVQQIEEFKLGPKKIAKLSAPGIKFRVIIAQIVAILQVLEEILSKARPPHLVELLKLNEKTVIGWGLTQAEIYRALQRTKKS